MITGYIYILQNPAFPDFLKIGCTKRDAKIRASELYTTGVPEQFHIVYVEDVLDYKEIERSIHKKLDEYRNNKRREFFQLQIHQAILKVQEVTQREQYRSETLMTLEENMTIRFYCYSQDVILIARYKNFEDLLEEKISIVDILTSGEGDQILISNRSGNDKFALDADEAVWLDVGECINGIIHGLYDIYPGDRIVWIGKSQGNSTNDGYSILTVLDCRAYAQLVGFSPPSNIIFIDGIPRPFGSDLSKLRSIPNSILREAVSNIRDLGTPRNWGSPTLDY